MSKRHEVSRSGPSAGHAGPSKEERRATNRKARHQTHELLQHLDDDAAEDIVTPRTKHTAVDLNGHEPQVKGDARPGREYRHWKQKFWKRRKSERARKAELLEEIKRTA